MLNKIISFFTQDNNLEQQDKVFQTEERKNEKQKMQIQSLIRENQRLKEQYVKARDSAFIYSFQVDPDKQRIIHQQKQIKQLSLLFKSQEEQIKRLEWKRKQVDESIRRLQKLDRKVYKKLGEEDEKIQRGLRVVLEALQKGEEQKTILALLANLLQ